MINEIQTKIMELLIEKKYSVEGLAEELLCSKRNIYKNLKLIEEILEKDLAINLIKEKSNYYIEEKFKKNIIEYIERNGDLSSKERQYYLLFKLLLEKKFNLEKERKFLDISRTTANSDMKNLKEMLDKYNLKVLSNRSCGIYVVGNEKDKFKILIEIIEIIFKEKYYIKKIIKNYLEEIPELINIKFLNKNETAALY